MAFLYTCRMGIRGVVLGRNVPMRTHRSGSRAAWEHCERSEQTPVASGASGGII